MKKTLLKTMLLIAISSIAQAQTILNGDFTNYSTVTNTSFPVTYTNWSGEAYVSNSINGGTNNGASLQSEITVTPGQLTCVSWAYDKITGKQYCVDYALGETTYTEKFQTLTQSVSINEIPKKITGKFSYFSAGASYNAAMIIEGNYNGQRFQDTLIVDNASSNSNTYYKELVISSNSFPCVEIIKNGFKDIYLDNCPVKNTIQIKLVSCLNCPVAPSVDKTAFSVDDLQIVNLATGIDDQNTINQTNIYPNPATDFINVSEFAEVFDLIGNKVAEGIDKIDVSSLINGIYLVKTAKGFDKIVVE
jgi:hypothetical protein